MKKTTKISLAIGAALCAGTAVADVPNAGGGNNFDQYTTDAGGNIILNNPGGTNGCPIGGTCQVLEATSPGILQQKVTYGGTSYFQTIIVDNEGGTIASIADPTTLGFRVENYVNAGDNGSSAATDLATQSIVQDGVVGFDKFVAEFEGQQGILIGNDLTNPTGKKVGEIFRQLNTLGDPDRTLDFVFENGDAAGKRMAIGMTTPVNEGQFALRRATGYFVKPPAGQITFNSGEDFEYFPGDSLQITHIVQAAAGEPSVPQSQRIFAETTLKSMVSNDGQTVAGNTYKPGTVTQDSAVGPQGRTVSTIPLVDGASVQFIGPFAWNVGLFGTKMKSLVAVGTTGTIVDHAVNQFGVSNPPWNVIVTP